MSADTKLTSVTRPTAPWVLLESFTTGREARSFLFSRPEQIIEARCPEEVLSALEAIQRQVDAGKHAAGFLAYEAASGLDDHLTVHDEEQFPLFWFGIFQQRQTVAPGLFRAEGTYQRTPWQSAISETGYRENFSKIRKYLIAGDTYQVNYSFKLQAEIQGDPFALFRDMTGNQRTAFSAYCDTGRWQVLSASPELLFSLESSRLMARPMKGTMPRGRWPEEDSIQRERLRRSEKDRSENLMIVDLLRNDLGRIAQTGSVEASNAFHIESYETVLQMTSTIQSKIQPGISIPELMQAMFPGGSITGAPKIRTMEIIRELEPLPRRIYTGSIGYFSPGPEAMFNIAIRTALVDSATGTIEMGVGSGVTIASTPDGEYNECLDKAQFTMQPRPDFQLLETMLHEGDQGYFLLERHVARLAASANYFGFQCDAADIRQQLSKRVQQFETDQTRVRALLSRNGELEIQHYPLDDAEQAAGETVGIAQVPVDTGQVWLFHKTTHRQVYEEALQSRPDCDHILLLNERGELTESNIANVALLIDGRWLTPPVESGLLNGTYRAEMLETGQITEAVLTKADIHMADRIALLNSVWRWKEVRFVEETKE
jgi:para-aminobenzoate synthetase / 4-amino-4-deoxychorismate lyase